MLNKKLRVNTALFSSLYKFLLLNLGIAFGLMALSCPYCFISFSAFKTIIPDLIFSFLISSALSIGGFKIESYFDTRISWIEKPIKRLFLTASCYLIYSFIVSFVLVLFYTLLKYPHLDIHTIPWQRVLQNTSLPVTIAVVIVTIFISRSWLYEWKNAAIEAEQLKVENLASQYQSLRDQLNPHFLFNSLNTLSNLVYEDADKSAAFIQQLSKVYRYVLEVQDEQLVSLSKELEFARHYLNLQKIRFEDGLNFSIDAEDISSYCIPPLSLQLLLENAMKHNIVSETQTLHISIKQIGEVLVVNNNLQQKHVQEQEDSGIGLLNIERRYQLLSEKIPEIKKSADKFTVILPLLKLQL